MNTPASASVLEKARPLVKGFFLSGLLCGASGLAAQHAVYESEPNNTPAEANPIAGEVTVFGAMGGNDQDGFLWKVSDEDARKRWTFELQGIPGKLSTLFAGRRSPIGLSLLTGNALPS